MYYKINKSLVFIIFILFQISFSQTDSNGKMKIEILKKYELGYVLHTPVNTKEKQPLLIFLHGSGEKGTNLEKLKVHGPLKYLKTLNIDSYVLAPQCPENEYWNSEVLYRLILKIQKENNIDPNRIYLTGLSEGGWGAWNLAFAHPDMFAALVPISGYVDLNQSEEACKIATIPTKIFHGLLDDVVNVDYTIAFYKELKKCNSNAELTIFSDLGHNSWTRVYENQDIYDWMFKQVKNK